MSLNSIEVRPCPKSTTNETAPAIEQLTTEQLNLAVSVLRDVEHTQAAIKALTSSYTGKAFKALGGNELDLAGQIVAVEGLDALFSSSERVRRAAKALEAEAYNQWKILRAFAQLLDKAEG